MAKRGSPRIARISPDGDFGSELARLTRALGSAADAADKSARSAGGDSSSGGGGPAGALVRAVQEVAIKSVGGAALNAIRTPGGGFGDFVSNVEGNASEIGGAVGGAGGAAAGFALGGPAGGRAGAKLGELAGGAAGAFVERETSARRIAREQAIAETNSLFAPAVAQGKAITKEEMAEVLQQAFEINLQKQILAQQVRDAANSRF